MVEFVSAALGGSEGVMKILRSLTRRGSRVESAGYFTVLMSGEWFPASRLPQGFHRHPGQLKDNDALGLETLNQAGNPQAAFLSQTMKLSKLDRRPMRFALIVMSAAAITYALLWWIGNPR
jgi:hypothetical protein